MTCWRNLEIKSLDGGNRNRSPSISLQTNADCNIKGFGKCVKHTGKEAMCCKCLTWTDMNGAFHRRLTFTPCFPRWHVRNAAYTSCKAGYYGASATYPGCRECPDGFTSAQGRAFYSTDCFLPCGDVSRVPDGICYTLGSMLSSLRMSEGLSP